MSNNPFATSNTTSTQSPVIDITKVQAVDIMVNHKCHDTINAIPEFIKKIGNWMYSGHRKNPSDINGITKSWKDVRNRNTFEDITTNNPNKLYYTIVLDGRFVVIDLDKCFDENSNLLEFAQEILTETQEFNPYIEKSLSGKGLHIIFKATESWRKKKNIQIKLKDSHDKYKDSNAGIDFLINNHCIILTGDIYQNNAPSKVGATNNKIKEIYNRLSEVNKKDIKNDNINYQKKKKTNSIDQTDVFQRINNLVSIEEVLNKYDCDGYSNGLIRCPFPGHNDSSPSLKIYHYSNTFHCFGCKKSGDVVQLVSEIEGLRNLESAKLLDKWFKLELNFDSIDNDANKEWILIDNDKIDVDLIALRNHLYMEHNVYMTEFDIYQYENGVYTMTDSNRVKRCIEEHMPSYDNNKYKGSYYVDEVFKMLQRNAISYKEFNNDKLLVNLKNKCLEFKLESDSIKELEHSPEFLTTFQIKGEYKPEVLENKDELWHKFLNDALPKGQQNLLQEIMGYLILNNNSAKKFFALYGVGDSGKSVILRVISKMIDEQYVSAMELQELTSKNNKFATYSLYGKLINMCGDISSKAIEDVSIIKQLTGNDKLRFEKKNGMSLFDYNTARMIFSMNKLPASYEKNKEFFNRLLILYFANSIPEEKQIKDLEDKFNMDYIINWSIEGLKRLIKNNLKFSTEKANDDLINEYVETDSPIVEFINEYCELTDDKQDYILQTSFVNAFKEFTRVILNDEKAGNVKTKNLVSDMKTRFGIKYSKNLLNPTTNTKTLRGFVGIKFKPELVSELTKTNMFNQ